eukprot:TRINITY_DN122335_c0_g1_i1.p1 TRINITY_DN122335_c0_g1~~TRINITY_DN122335_c0_g1_i1.p1  ORF type:complete len:673 (-),score=247.39 TRINITY_DN122335_c0_g1_i1:129-2147(-)
MRWWRRRQADKKADDAVLPEASAEAAPSAQDAANAGAELEKSLDQLEAQVGQTAQTGDGKGRPSDETSPQGSIQDNVEHQEADTPHNAAPARKEAAVLKLPNIHATEGKGKKGRRDSDSEEASSEHVERMERMVQEGIQQTKKRIREAKQRELEQWREEEDRKDRERIAAEEKHKERMDKLKAMRRHQQELQAFGKAEKKLQEEEAERQAEERKRKEREKDEALRQQIKGRLKAEKKKKLEEQARQEELDSMIKKYKQMESDEKAKKLLDLARQRVKMVKQSVDAFSSGDESKPSNTTPDGTSRGVEGSSEAQASSDVLRRQAAKRVRRQKEMQLREEAEARARVEAEEEEKRRRHDELQQEVEERRKMAAKRAAERRRAEREEEDRQRSEKEHLSRMLLETKQKYKDPRKIAELKRGLAIDRLRPEEHDPETAHPSVESMRSKNKDKLPSIMHSCVDEQKRSEERIARMMEGQRHQAQGNVDSQGQDPEHESISPHDQRGDAQGDVLQLRALERVKKQKAALRMEAQLMLEKVKEQEKQVQLKKQRQAELAVQERQRATHRSVERHRKERALQAEQRAEKEEALKAVREKKQRYRDPGAIRALKATDRLLVESPDGEGTLLAAVAQVTVGNAALAAQSGSDGEGRSDGESGVGRSKMYRGIDKACRPALLK